MKRWWPWILLGVIAVVVVAVAAWPRGGDESLDAHTRRLASEIRCVDCQGLSVADSSTGTARATRADIRARIRRGESDADIRRVYVDRYGETVLLKPASSGIGVLVWAPAPPASARIWAVPAPNPTLAPLEHLTEYENRDVYLINKKRKKKIARNISRNTAIVIDEHFIPSFKPAKIFINKIKNSDKVKQLAEK